MLRIALLFATLAVAALCLSAPGGASDTCARATGGRCQPGQNLPSSTGNSSAITHKKTQPPSKGNHKSREDYTAAQREKIMENARKLCKAKFGAPSRVHRIDYKRNEVWCEPPNY